MLDWSHARCAAVLSVYGRRSSGAPPSPHGALRRPWTAAAAVALAAGARLSRAVPLATPLRQLSATTPRYSGTFHYRKVRVTPEDAIDPLTKPTTIDKAALHVVSVPIGNLKDFTLRALDVLRGVDYIVTTDRPATKTLLDLVNIPNQGRLIHYSRTNRTASRDKLVELLKGGRSMALVTTSGTPCVGDVGGELVREMQQSGIRVTAVPGASAVMCALAVSGLTTSTFESSDKVRAGDGRDGDGGGAAALLQPQTFDDGSFFFGNVLPESHGARLRLLRSVVAPATFPCVFYEVPRRLVTVLQDVAAVLPHRRVYVTHELTKLNESLHADTAEQLVRFYLRQEAQMLLKKGQLVLVIAGAGPMETAAWLEKEAAKRRRLRRSVSDLMRSGAARAAAAASAATPRDDSSNGAAAAGGTAATPKAKHPLRRQQRAELRRQRLKKKRERLIREIEAEQERLRVNLAINRNDAARFP